MVSQNVKRERERERRTSMLVTKMLRGKEEEEEGMKAGRRGTSV